MTQYSVELKQAAIEDARTAIVNGDTMQQIAARHGITSRTLNTWMLALEDGEYENIRKQWIDNLVAGALDEMETVGQTEIEADEVQKANFLLARTRDKFKAISWLAQTRDSRYSPVQQQAVVQINMVPPALQASASTLLDSMYSHVTPHQAAIEQEGQGGQGGGTVFPDEVVPPVVVGSNMSTSGLSLTNTSSLCQEMTPSMNGSDTLE